MCVYVCVCVGGGGGGSDNGTLTSSSPLRGVPRIFGGGGARSAKEANKPNKRATGLKPRTCAHQGSMFRPY